MFFVIGHYDEEDLARPRTALRGGNDRITGTTARARIAGDVFSVSREGRVFGGHDTIDLSEVAEVSSLWVFGDVGGISGDGGSAAEWVEGGNDRIFGPRGSTGTLPILIGDVGTIEYPADPYASRPTVIGGHDRIVLHSPALAVGDIYDAGPADLRGGNDTLVGSPGDDTLVGDFYHLFDGWGICGDDVLRGGAGNDRLFGDRPELNAGGDAGGHDRISGGDGDDTVDGGVGDDTLSGGTGRDTLTFETIEVGVIVDLVSGIATGQGTDNLRGFENVIGTTNADHITGHGGANLLDGGYGADTLIGGRGNDTLVAGGGGDSLTGGTGADAFKFISADGSSARLADFRSGTDRIEVVSSNFGGLPAGPIAAATFRRVDLPHTLAITNRPLFLYDGTSGALSFDLDGDGPRSAVPIASLTGRRTLVTGDIQVVVA